MLPIDISFPIVTDNADDQRRWEENIVEKLKEISGVDVVPKFAKPNYESYIRSSVWQMLRDKIVYDYDYDGKCYMCGTKDNIRVHHITYIRLGDEHHSDLIPLCADCHKKIHELKDDLAPIIEDVHKQLSKHKSIVNAMRQMLKDKMNVFISYHASTIFDAIEKHLPNVIAGHKPKIASMIGNTLFYDILERACPINKDIIKHLKGIEKK